MRASNGDERFSWSTGANWDELTAPRRQAEFGAAVLSVHSLFLLAQLSGSEHKLSTPGPTQALHKQAHSTLGFLQLPAFLAPPLPPAE